MRTTLTIDDDVLAAARELAKRERRSLGEVISALAREGLTQVKPSSKTERNGIPLLPKRETALPITLHRVNHLRDEPP